jgi:tryptophan synthase beta chain
VKSSYAFDHEVFEAARLMCKTEGLLPALETAHALAYVLNHDDEFDRDSILVVNYSGRGDKDLETIAGYSYGH